MWDDITRRRFTIGDVVRVKRMLIGGDDGPVDVPVGCGGVVKSCESEWGNVWVVFPELNCKETVYVGHSDLELQDGITGHDGLLRLRYVSQNR